MSAPARAVVRKVDLERFKLDGGVLVVYPPRRDGGLEIIGMVTVELREVKPRRAPMPKGPLKGEPADG